MYLTLHESGQLVGATYFYIKNNSYGEFIFDFAWAQAYSRHGVRYFPKIVSAVPFTPATGEKLLLKKEHRNDANRQRLIEGVLNVMSEIKCSSTHFLFIPPEHLSVYSRCGLTIRHSFQYHWINRGYGNFDDFLAALTSKRRRQIQLERRQLNETGIRIETLTGDALKPEHARLMFEYYRDTNEKMGSVVCLNLEFFETIFESMHDRIVLFVAHQQNSPVAAAINFFKGNAMYGRYWGCSHDIRNLHFELCYYRAIEHAITQKMTRYEAGAQGEHKFPRGFLPQLTYSAHAIVHPEFRDAIAHFIEDEKAGVEQLFAEYAEHSPYR